MTFQESKRQSRKLDLKSTLIQFCIACFVQFILLRQFNIDIQTALIDTLSTNVLLLLAVFILQKIVNSFLSKSVLSLVNFEIILAMTALIVAGSFFTGKLLIENNELNQQFKTPYLLAKSTVIFLQLFVAHYQFWFSKNQLYLEVSLNQKLTIERDLQKAELNRIEQTIQPHFLFNSLNSISALMVLDANEAQRMLLLLSDYLRQMVRKEKSITCRLEEEIEDVKLYLEIEKIRFKERLEIEFENDGDNLDYQIPVFILQPLVENAVKYGLYGTDEKVKICIASRILKDKMLEISISNPYDAETQQTQKGEGFGLSSIKKKLNLLYHRNDLLKIEKSENQFKATLKLPKL